MDISKISNVSFNGLLTISGPNKNKDVIVNTEGVSTINVSPYVGGKDGNTFNVGISEGAVLTMNNGTKINTFLPLENVVAAYKQAEVKGEAKLETEYNPVMGTPLIG